MHPEHPVKLVVEDDLKRNRWTVFFRLLLAIPHFIWVLLWSIAAVFTAVLNWIVTLIAGTPPAGLHGFMRGLAWDAGAAGVVVNVIAPGITRTEQIRTPGRAKQQ